MEEFQFGVGMIGLGSGVYKGQACLVMKRAQRQGMVGSFSGEDQTNFTDEGALLLLGNRKSAGVLLRHLKMAIALLPK